MMSTQHIRERIERASDPQRGVIDRVTADNLLRACDADDRALMARVEAALASDEHELACDHWRGEGHCSCLPERIRAAVKGG